MPHFVIECSKSITIIHDPEEIMNAVYETALSTGLFAESGEGGIKVRLKPFSYYITVGSNDDFMHVFAYIMEGRTSEQKLNLSKLIVAKLKSLLPDVPIISMNVIDFDKSSYCNRSMI